MIGLSPQADNLWVKPRQPDSRVNVRLFCFPYSGAGASIYYKWADVLPSIVSVYPVQLPGRETRIAESPFTQLEPLIMAAANALLPHLGQKFAFFGHSMGALVAYELTRFLQQHLNLSPVHVFVSGFGAPHLPSQHSPIHHLPTPDFVQELRKLKGTPEEVFQHRELRDLVLPILRSDFAVCETYRYRPAEPLPCPISAFGGLEDAEVPRSRLEAWREQTNREFKLRMFPGDHFYLNHSRLMLLRAVAAELGGAGK